MVYKNSFRKQSLSTYSVGWLSKWKLLSFALLCSAMDYAVHQIILARTLEWYPFFSPGDFPNPEIKLRSPTLQLDCLPAEPQEKPKNTGAGSLSFLQQIFLNQESNWGLLHCKWILYQLSYQVSPLCGITGWKIINLDSPHTIQKNLTQMSPTHFSKDDTLMA